MTVIVVGGWSSCKGAGRPLRRNSNRSVRSSRWDDTAFRCNTSSEFWFTPNYEVSVISGRHGGRLVILRKVDYAKTQ